jgi:integrase
VGSNPIVSAKIPTPIFAYALEIKVIFAFNGDNCPPVPLELLHILLHKMLHGDRQEGRMAILKRGSSFHLRRRVPRRFKAVEPRGTVWISLHTDSESLARQKADRAWAQMVEAWEARLHGNTEDAEARFEAAKELAAVRGFRYLDMTSIARGDPADRLARVEAISSPNGQPDMAEAVALLGAVPATVLNVGKALETYWSLTRENILGKSEDQLRRWRNPRIKALRNFVEVVGDKALDQITRDDLLDFRQFWLERIESGAVTANSANKDLIHLADVLKTVVTQKRLGISLPLGDLSFKEGPPESPPPFSDDWIRDKILAAGAMDGMNGEARAILLGMVNTGYRPSEGAALTAATIRLDDDVPHICIRPEGRQIKSVYSKRDIPLVGVSLEAFKAFPNGFPRYRESSASLSATVNKFLRARGLMETPRHKMYSLRHSFEDRMLAAGIDERIRRDVVGHRLDRERYGAGAALGHVAKLLEGISF